MKIFDVNNVTKPLKISQTFCYHISKQFMIQIRQKTLLVLTAEKFYRIEYMKTSYTSTKRHKLPQM